MASDNVWRAMEKIDHLMTHLMRRAEKGCRKLYKEDYDFSL